MFVAMAALVEGFKKKRERNFITKLYKVPLGAYKTGCKDPNFAKLRDPSHFWGPIYKCKSEASLSSYKKA